MAETRDPLARKSYADTIVVRAAEQLHGLLKEAAAELRPFPSFPGALFTCAIECEPGAAASGEHGCVVVKEDGELYELQLGIDFSGIEFGDPVSMRSEETRPLQLHPCDYVVYAYNGLGAITDRLLEAQGDATAGR